MPDVLVLKGIGEAITLLEPRDILPYVGMYMGQDAQQYIRDAIENRGAFQDVSRHLEILEAEISKSRWDKRKITEQLDEIERIIV